MYIRNPTEDQLKNWYKCKINVAKYLMATINPIHCDIGGYYYFEKTEELLRLIETIPIIYVIYDKFLKFF